MVISNMIGPVEQMAFANFPVTGLYYMLVDTPEVYIYIKDHIKFSKMIIINIFNLLSV